MDFWRFATVTADPAREVLPAFAYQLGWVSLALAALAACSMLPAVGRLRRLRDPGARRTWVAAGSLALAFGAWATFFTAMLGMSLPVTSRLDLGGALLTVCAGLPFFAAALALLGSRPVRPWRLHAGALLLSLGMAATDLAGMEALHLDGSFVYAPAMAALALGLSYGLALLGLYVDARLQPLPGFARILLASALIGACFAGFHFALLSGARFFAAGLLVPGTALANPLVIPAVVVIACALAAVLWFGSLVDARLGRMAESLKRSEARNRAVIASMPDAHMTCDARLGITSFNPAAERLFGCSAEVALEHKLVDLLPAAACLVAEDPHAAGAGGESATRELEASLSDGRSVEVTINRFAAGDGDYFNVLVRDVSARRAAETELRQLATAVRNAPDVIEILDAAGRTIYVNPAYERTMGYTLAEVRGRTPVSKRGFVTGTEGLNRMMAGLQAADLWNGRIQSRGPRGEVLEEDVAVSMIRDPAGQCLSYVLIRRDVSQQVQLERQLRQAQKLESIGQLAAGIAHEINTPAQYVGDNIRFLKDAFTDLSRLLDDLAAVATGPDTNPGLRAALDKADADYLRREIPRAVDQSLEGVERVAGIVRAMKEFSHPAQERTPTDLNRAIASTVTVATNEWKYVADLQLELDEGLPPVPVLPGEFNQVMLNLLVNAAHAIAAANQAGPGSRGRIVVRTRAVPGSAEIQVRDDGCGMPPDVLRRIFDPFFTTKSIGKGSGQGLAIAHNVIVEKHGGTIDVASEPGRGSTFTIHLPLAAAPSRVHAA